MNQVLVLLIIFINLIMPAHAADNLILRSDAFGPNGMIPKEYTCDGTDESPPLSWTNIPENTQSLALIAEDPDAPDGAWTHWVVFNLSPTVIQLSGKTALPEGALSAKNSWNAPGYRGPCPPLGAHRYVFTLYALDKMLPLDEKAGADEVRQAMTGHVLGRAQLTGIYQKVE